MKKGIIAVVALIAASGLSIGAFFAVKNKDDKENSKKKAELAENELAQLDSASINKIQINAADGEYTLILDGDIWVNDPASGNDFVINQNMPMGICTLLKDFKAYKNYGDITEESKQYLQAVKVIQSISETQVRQAVTTMLLSTARTRYTLSSPTTQTLLPAAAPSL